MRIKENRKVTIEFVKKDFIHNDNIIEIFVKKIREKGFDNNEQKS